MMYGHYNWKMPKKCKTCQYRSPGTTAHAYSCDYALITGQTRTGLLVAQYGNGYSKALLEPKNCPFYEKGDKISTLQTTVVEGSERSMKRLEPEFRKLHAEGLTDYEIASKLHKSFSTIHSFRNKLGLKPNIRKQYIGARMHDEISQLYDEGLNDSEISRQLCISPGVVARWRKKHNKPAHINRGRPKDGQHSSMGSSSDVHNMGLNSSADSDSERGGAETRSERGSMESVGEELL